MVNYRGWSDPVGKLEAFRVVIKYLVSRTDNFRIRMEKATLPLVGMRPEDFPKRIRGRAERVLTVRSAVAVEYVNDTLWHFERLTPKQRKVLIDDLLRLYESLLIDLGRMGKDYDFIYPKDT
jgi:hypothetical protein